MKRVVNSNVKKQARLDVSFLIEELESRVLLAANLVTWVGTTGLWEQGTNWSSGRIPNASDNVSIPAGALVRVFGNDQAAKVTIAAGAALDVINGSYLARGTLQISRGLSNAGELAIGPYATVTIKNGGSYAQSQTGVLTIDLAGKPATGNFGQIVSNGPFTLAGAFQTSIQSGYTPSAGDVFGPISYGAVSGNFSSLSTQGGGAIAFAPVIGTTGSVLIGAVDSTPPASTITGLPSDELDTTFTVNWAGIDNIGGSGVQSYSVFVSDNGGTFAPFITTSLTSAPFAGAVGHFYGFYSVATDNAGNVQPTPTAAQMTTSVDGEILPGPQGGIIILGTDGADTIRIGESGGNVVISRDGTTSSVKTGKAKSITIQSGAGNDSITLAPSAPAVSINAGGGADTIISKNDAANTLNGGAGSDSITGGLGNELIEGGKGSNTLIAGSGNDTLIGGPGPDSITGGPGADLLLGGGGLDTISAGSEDSTIDGNRGL